LKVEIQDADGTPIPGFTLKDAAELFGDSTLQIASWNSSADVSQLSGKPVRLHFELKDGDLYSFQFTDSEAP
jgi:hypothetical protein